MPLMQGLLRRKGPATSASDANIRRHSFLSPDTLTMQEQPIIDGRASEQIPRRPSAADFLTPTSTTGRPTPGRMSAESGRDRLERSISPTIQDETQKHRRFSMLRFRHASDPQLSARAKLHATHQTTQPEAPPLPRRENTLIEQLNDLANMNNSSS
jgi:hypothetical protein